MYTSNLHQKQHITIVVSNENALIKTAYASNIIMTAAAIF